MDRRPQARRVKTYTGQTGYVYQYYFVGQRRAFQEDPAAPAVEYVFDVTSDRVTTFAVSVLLQDTSVELWQAAHSRKMVDAERYASAKLRLMQAFDEIPAMKDQGRRLVITPEDLEDLLGSIGLE